MLISTQYINRNEECKRFSKINRSISLMENPDYGWRGFMGGAKPKTCNISGFNYEDYPRA